MLSRPLPLTKVNHLAIIKVNHFDFVSERKVKMVKAENARIAVLIVPEVKEVLERVIKQGYAKTYSGAVRYLIDLGREVFEKQEVDKE